MKTKRLTIAAIAAALTAGCAHSITPEEALTSLYQKISIPDSLDYTRGFYEENVASSLRARKELPWGKTVTDEDFLNFVVPVRTNNEKLDRSRMEFYEELAPRIKNMSMRDAALEVNHWAHEKATYRPSDMRTSSPLATVKTSWGRCGEESAFVVAAMRAVCIPSRQVYTPRWAHTDDNHAWVEVMIDGKWQFLGGCEPEPDLNIAWFNGPAARGMLMETRTDGTYSGNEEILFSSPYYSLINVTPNYAPTEMAEVTVTDENGKPAKGAKVMFCIYNYAEYYPVATKQADENGKAGVTAGKGDMMVWATDGERFGVKKMTVGKDRNFTIALDHKAGDAFTEDFDLVPPPNSGTLPHPDAKAVAVNEARKIHEDSIRNAYMATFMTADRARRFAEENGIDAAFAEDVLPKAYGNHKTLTDFLRNAKDKKRATAILSVISEKDLRDITAEVLEDATENTEADTGKPLFNEFVLNPRVAHENLTPYRAFFRHAIPQAEREAFKANPQTWVAWVRDNIAVSSEKNPRRLIISPESVYSHRRDIDPQSRNVMFVAGARSMGIPARIDVVTGNVEYSADGEKWTDVSFETAEPESAVKPRGELVLDFTATGHIDDPKYLGNFSISKIDGNGVRQMAWEDFAPWSTTFRNGVEMEEGYYVLTTGQRMADGGVLARSRFFNIKAGETMRMPIEIRQDTAQVQVIGSFNSENPFTDMKTGQETTILAANGRGYFTVGVIQPNHEPSVHALNDLISEAKALEENGTKIFIIFADAEQAGRFKADTFKGLPENVVFGIDSTGAIVNDLEENMKMNGNDKPLFIIGDTFNRVVFASQGYMINLGATLAGVLRRL